MLKVLVSLANIIMGTTRPSQLAPGGYGSLNPELECQYYKDTGQLRDNCIKLNCWLAYEQKTTEKRMAN